MRQKYSNKKGQAVVEAVLYLATIVFIFSLIKKTFNEEQYIESLVSGPWKQLSGMIQNGRWGTPQETMHLHPSNWERVGSYDK